MPTIVGILTFISMINTTYERFKANFFFTFQYFSVYEQLIFPAHEISFITSRPGHFYCLTLALLAVTCLLINFAKIGPRSGPN